MSTNAFHYIFYVWILNAEFRLICLLLLSFQFAFALFVSVI